MKEFKTEKGVEKLNFENFKYKYQDILDSQIDIVSNKYKKYLSSDEIEQHLLIDLWKAYETYDIERGNIEDYIKYRFGISRRDIKNKVSKIKKRNKNFTSLIDNIIIDETPEDNVITKNLIKCVYNCCDDDDELELINILIYKKEYTVIDYAEKYGLSRMTVYNRLNKLKNKIIKKLKEDGLID